MRLISPDKYAGRKLNGDPVKTENSTGSCLTWLTTEAFQAFKADARPCGRVRDPWSGTHGYGACPRGTTSSFADPSTCSVQSMGRSGTVESIASGRAVVKKKSENWHPSYKIQGSFESFPGRADLAPQTEAGRSGTGIFLEVSIRAGPSGARKFKRLR
jgi:hypothetical protein